MSLYWMTKTGDVASNVTSEDLSLQQQLNTTNANVASNTATLSSHTSSISSNNASIAALNLQVAQLSLTTTAAGNSSATLTASSVLGGILTSNPGAAITLTLPTAAQLVAADNNAAVGKGYRFTIINLNGTNAITLAGGTGITLVGTAGINANTSGSFYLSYTNVTSGTQAITIYRTA